MKTVFHTDPVIITSTILDSKVCYVGMVDMHGFPYVLPMNFGYQDGVVYLHSALEESSIHILEHHPEVCLVFNPSHEVVHQHSEVACSYRMRSKSVMGWGKVVFEEDLEKKADALRIIMKNYSDKVFSFSEPSIKHVKIWIVKLEKVTCKEFGAPHFK